MGQNELGTLSAVKVLRSELIDPLTSEHGGRVFKATGDGFLAEFPSVVNAVACAVAVQQGTVDRNFGLPEDRQLVLRIGINLGDVIIEGEDVFGDGVNVAVRVENLAPPGGVAISQMVRDNIGNRLDLFLEDIGEHQLKNIDRGVRISLVRLRSSTRQIGPALPVGEGALTTSTFTDRPSIAVLPFVNLVSESEKAYFADGITLDLINELGRFRELIIVSGSSVFAYKNRPMNAVRIGAELGARYILEGSVQLTGSVIKLNAQLVDTASGKQLWAERYTRASEQLFDVQAELVRALVAALTVNIDWVERERVKRKVPNSLSAYDAYQRGRQALASFTKVGHQKARGFFEEAIKLDPQYARAWSELATYHINNMRYGWSEDAEGSLNDGLAAARTSLGLDPLDYHSHWTMGFVLVFSRHFDEGIAEYEKAIDLNPNDPDLLADMAESLVYVGRRQEAVDQVRRAMSINPIYEESYLFTLAWANYLDRNFEAALTFLRRINRPPPFAIRLEAATLAQLGQMQGAVVKAAEFRKLEPGWTLSLGERWPYRNPADRDLKLDGLRKAGFPEMASRS